MSLAAVRACMGTEQVHPPPPPPPNTHSSSCPSSSSSLSFLNFTSTNMWSVVHFSMQYSYCVEYKCTFCAHKHISVVTYLKHSALVAFVDLLGIFPFSLFKTYCCNCLSVRSICYAAVWHSHLIPFARFKVTIFGQRVIIGPIHPAEAV